MTAEGVVTYPHPIDSHTSSRISSPVCSSGEIHVFMNRSERNYLRLQGDHKYDISYGAGHSSFLLEEKERRDGDHCQVPSQPSTKCSAGPSTSYSSQQSISLGSETSLFDTSAKLKGLSLGKVDISDTARSETSHLKESNPITGQTPYQVHLLKLLFVKV